MDAKVLVLELSFRFNTGKLFELLAVVAKKNLIFFYLMIRKLDASTFAKFIINYCYYPKSSKDRPSSLSPFL